MNISAQMVEAIASFTELSTGRSASIPRLLADCGYEMPVHTLEAGEPGSCYETATQTANSFGLYYCEGYAVPGEISIPLPHAWNIDEEGGVTDLTWGDGHSYYGLVIPWHVVVKVTSQTMVYGVLDNLWLIPHDAEWVLDEIRKVNCEGHAVPTEMEQGT